MLDNFSENLHIFSTRDLKTFKRVYIFWNVVEGCVCVFWDIAKFETTKVYVRIF